MKIIITAITAAVVAFSTPAAADVPDITQGNNVDFSSCSTPAENGMVVCPVVGVPRCYLLSDFPNKWVDVKAASSYVGVAKLGRTSGVFGMGLLSILSKTGQPQRGEEAFFVIVYPQEAKLCVEAYLYHQADVL